MRNKKALRLFLGIIFAVAISKLQANLDGTGGTSIYLASNYTFTDYEVAKGFVRFAGGFTLPPSGKAFVRVTEAVSGPINLNGGILELQDDLYLGSSATITGTGGTIIGNNKTIYLGSDLLITNSIQLALSTQDNFVNFDGRGNSIKFSAVGNPMVGFNMPGSLAPFSGFIKFSNMRILNATAGLAGVEPFAFPLNNGASTFLTFENVEISSPSIDTLTAQFVLRGSGPIPLGTTIRGMVTFVGNKTILALLGGVFVAENSTLHMGPTTQLLFDSSNAVGITFDGINSTIILDNCDLIRNFASNGTPWTLTKGRMVVEGYANFNIEPGQQPLVIGDGISPANDFNVEILPGSTFAVGVNKIRTANGVILPEAAEIIYQNIF